MKILHKYLILFTFLGFSLSLAAQSADNNFLHGRHSLRVGWGDAFLASNYSFEPLYGMTLLPVYPQSIQPALDAIVGMPAYEADAFLREYRFVELGEMTSIGHFFLSYHYQLTPLISLGLEVDYLQMKMGMKWYNGYHTLLSPNKERGYEYLHHLTLMPSLRITYYSQRVLTLYSALGVGYACYADSPVGKWQTDRQRNTNHGLALNITALGINIGGKHWFAEAELGSFQSWAFNAADNGLYGSRILSVAVGCRF